MAVELNLTSVLVEGFDATKIKKDVDYDKDWNMVVSAKQNEKILQSEILGIERIGKGQDAKASAIVDVGKIRGYIPLEHMGVDNLRNLRAMTGQKVAFKIVEYIEDGHDVQLFIASRTEALKEMADITLRKIKEGDEILAVVRSVSPSLIRADIGGIEVKIPLHELRYGWVDNLTEEVEIGDHLNVKVMSIDKKNQTVIVSPKALLDNPWEAAKGRYKVGAEYVGKVSGIRGYGVFVNLEHGVDSLASHLKYQTLEKGDKVLVRIASVDKKDEQVRVKIVRVI